MIVLIDMFVLIVTRVGFALEEGMGRIAAGNHCPPHVARRRTRCLKVALVINKAHGWTILNASFILYLKLTDGGWSQEEDRF